MQDSTQSAKNNHVSRIQANTRLSPLRLAIRRVAQFHVGCGLIGLLSVGGVAADSSEWDCRPAPGGRSWQCLKDGQPVVDPAPAAAATVEPAEPLPPTQAIPLPLEAGGIPAATTEPLPTQTPAAIAPPDAPAQPVVEAPPPPPARAPHPPASSVPSTVVPSSSDTDATPTPDAGATVAAPTRAETKGAIDRAKDLRDLTAPAIAEPASETAPPETHQPPPLSVSAPEPEQAALPTDDTFAQSATGENARRIDRGIDWDTCRVTGPGGPRLGVVTPPAADAPVEITADTAVAELDPEQAVFSGNVQLSQDGMQLQADEITLDRAAGRVDARGDLLLSSPDIRFSGSSATYSLTTGEAQVEQAHYRIPATRARGDAEKADFLGNGVSRFDTITYTTCAPGDSSWLLSAESLELDQNEGLGKATNASLRFLGVPLLYAPRFTFPIDDRRRSGVLVPTVGYSSNTGTDISVPYYFNLAENYDLTLTPRLMSKRGLMLGGEFRFLTETTHGALTAELLPDDRVRDTGSSTRGAVSFRSRTWFNQRTEANLRLNYVSDSDYLSDLGRSLAATSATHVRRSGELVYHADTWDLTGRVQYYQTVDDTIAFANRPYSQLPVIRLGLENPGGPGGTTYHLDAEYINFYRRNSVRGHRIDLAPALSLPLGEAWWFVEPKVGARYTAYDLTDQLAGLDASPSHGTGLLNLDAGLYFDRAISWFGNAATQTLEPRAYYLFVPSSSQSDQPLFDTTVLDFNFDNLFRENRFNGPDRVGDANQLTLALTSRVNSEVTGEELLRASVGQILYFDDRDVMLGNEADVDESTSAIVGEIAARLGGGWRTRAGLQWDPHDGNDGTIDQALAQLSYRDDQRHVANAAYRLRDGVVSQTDLAFYWPLSERLSLVGRHYYSLRESRLLEALAGIEYGKCCWRIRALARRYTDSNGNDHNLAFMLQLELNGLGRLGDDIDSTLERGIYGYRTDEDD